MSDLQAISRQKLGTIQDFIGLRLSTSKIWKKERKVDWKLEKKFFI